VDNTKEFTHISLCTGYGGIDIGLKRALGNVRTIAFSEIEAYAVANLVAKMEKGLLDVAPIWTNLKTFPWEKFCGKVDILSGGFPCQPFSGAGEGTGDNDPRHLFPYIKRGVELVGPSIVFLENVQGILKSKLQSNQWSDPINTPVLLHVFRELERVGYTPTAGIFSASEVGAPHQRKRIFILAVSNKLKQSGFDIITKHIEQSNRANLTTTINRYYSKDYNTAYPNYREPKQYRYEASRQTVGQKEMDHTNSKRLEGKILSSKPREKLSKSFNGSGSHGNIQRILESSMGRAIDGFACGMGSSKLFKCYDNRVDELRMLGNGVVPDTAKKAFLTLFKELSDSLSLI